MAQLDGEYRRDRPPQLEFDQRHKEHTLQRLPDNTHPGSHTETKQRMNPTKVSVISMIHTTIQETMETQAIPDHTRQDQICQISIC